MTTPSSPSPTPTAPTDPAIPAAAPAQPGATQGIDEVRFFNALDAHMTRSFAEFRKDMVNASVQEHEKTRRHVAQLTSMTKTLWTEVFAKATPPPGGDDLSFSLTEPDTNPGHTKDSKPIPAAPSGKISAHDATLDGLQGQVIAVDG